MKIILISAFLCLAGLSQAGNVQRYARNTEAIIPSIVEEILKVELQSDLKKNSAIEDGPVVKTIKDVVVDPVAGRIIEEVVTVEEKQPEVVEAVKEVVPEVVPATRNVEPAAEIVEKVEIVAVQEPEKPVDNFRTESVPAVEQVAEVVKEIIPAEAVSELRQEPEAAVVIKEEIVQPMFRNVVKEEIPQVEELRTVPVEAVKDIVPEVVPAANIASGPVVAVEPQVKTVVIETVKEEIPEVRAAPVIPPAPVVHVPVEIVKDEPVKEEVAVVPDIKAVPEVKPIVAPVRAVPAPVEAAPAPVDTETDPQTRQDRPTIVQQIQQNLAGLPVVGQIFNRNPVVADEAAPADDAAPAPVAEEKPPAPAGPLAPIGEFLQNAVAGAQQNIGTFITNAQNIIAPTNNESRPPGPIAQFVSGALSNVNNIINPTTASPVKDETKPEKMEDKPEATKSVEPEPAVVADPVVVQKEVVEPQKIVEGENENIVKV